MTIFLCAVYTVVALAVIWGILLAAREWLPGTIRRPLCRVFIHGYQPLWGTAYYICPDCGHKGMRTPFMGHSMQDMIDMDFSAGLADCPGGVNDEASRRKMHNRLVRKHYACWWPHDISHYLVDETPAELNK